MSELEKNKRDRYKKSRGKLILLQSAVISVLTLLVIVCLLTYTYINNVYYVDYSEVSNVDYKVQLKDNDFYGMQYLDGNRTYVASLIDGIIANFKYELHTDAKNVSYEYSYKLEAELQILDARSGDAIFNPTYSLKDERTYFQNTDNALVINEIAVLDYDEYNELARRFIETYELENVKSTLAVRMSVTVLSNGMGDSGGTHTTVLNVPLTSRTVDIEMSASVPTAESKVLAYDTGAAREVFKVAATVLFAMDIIAALLLTAFVLLTRTGDISYSGKVRKLDSAYKSYIRRIGDRFDRSGYQTVRVASLDDIIELGETLGLPVLTYENEEKTYTELVIPTATGILYLFTLSADGTEEPYTDKNGGMSFDKSGDNLREAENNGEVNEKEPMPTAAVEEKEPDGVEVIGVKWRESRDGRVYHYDPDGESLDVGDVVLVPSRDEAGNKDVEREAEVAEANRIADASEITHPLKKIIRVVRRKAQSAFTSMIVDGKQQKEQKKNND